MGVAVPWAPGTLSKVRSRALDCWSIFISKSSFMKKKKSGWTPPPSMCFFAYVFPLKEIYLITKHNFWTPRPPSPPRGYLTYKLRTFEIYLISQYSIPQMSGAPPILTAPPTASDILQSPSSGLPPGTSPALPLTQPPPLHSTPGNDTLSSSVIYFS